MAIRTIVPETFPNVDPILRNLAAKQISYIRTQEDSTFASRIVINSVWIYFCFRLERGSRRQLKFYFIEEIASRQGESNLSIHFSLEQIHFANSQNTFPKQNYSSFLSTTLHTGKPKLSCSHVCLYVICSNRKLGNFLNLAQWGTAQTSVCQAELH